MRIDLHTHSAVSDGTDSPSELVEKAAACGLDVVALTDHDTTAGWAEAQAAAGEAGITLVRGLEISTQHRGSGVHLLAYLPDPEHPGLVSRLGRILAGRTSRAPAMIQALNDAGIAISLDDVGERVVTGRPHVADALVRLEVVKSRDEAFAEWLNPGKAGYVDRYAAPLVEMIEVVAEAGGVTVIAHPWGRGRRDALPAAELAALKAAGLSGVEIDHRDHERPGDVRDELRDIATDLDLVITGSSDYHGTGKVNHDLGCHTTAPEQYERLMTLAAQASATAT